MGFPTVTLVLLLCGYGSAQRYSIDTIVGSNIPLNVVLPADTFVLPADLDVSATDAFNTIQRSRARAVLPPILRPFDSALISRKSARQLAEESSTPFTTTIELENLVSSTSFPSPLYTSTTLPSISLEGNPEEIVDKIISQTSLQGGKILKSVTTLIKNPLIAKLLASNAENDDPCAIVPTNLDVITQNIIEGVTSSRDELVAMVRLVQNMKAAGNETVQVLRYASEAVKLMDPLIPKFSSVFKANEACNTNIKSTIKGLDSVGNVLTTLGKTNIVAKDDYTKTRFVQGGEAFKIISRLAGIFTILFKSFLKQHTLINNYMFFRHFG